MKTLSPELIEYPCAIQPKLNGISASLSTDGLLRSKDGLYFPALGLQWPIPRRTLYGEIYLHGWPLQDIIAAAVPDKPVDLSFGLCLYVYDFESVTYQIQRMTDLPFMVPDHPRLILVPTTIVRCYSEILAAYKEFVHQGYEGIIVRGYRDGIWKKKPFRDEEFVCLGVIEGKGKRTGHVGKFVCKTKDGKVFHCGGGQISYDKLKFYFKHPPIGKKLTLRFNSRSKDNIPLCAQFIAVRSEYES